MKTYRVALTLEIDCYEEDLEEFERNVERSSNWVAYFGPFSEFEGYVLDAQILEVFEDPFEDDESFLD